MDPVETAAGHFEAGFNCAQAVLAAYAAGRNLDERGALKLATGFGGGMGCLGEQCGAVTGAVMALSLAHGRETLADTESKGKTYGLVKEFAARFKAEHGTLVCRELLGVDIGTPEGMAAAQEKALFTTVCPVYVRDAARFVGELI